MKKEEFIQKIAGYVKKYAAKEVCVLKYIEVFRE